MSGKAVRDKSKKWTSGPPPQEPHKQYVNPGEEDQMEIEGYCPSTWRKILTCLLGVLTCGILMLVFYWIPRRYLWFTHVRCKLSDATSVLLRDQYLQYFVQRVKTITKDGTRVEVLKPSVRFSIGNRARHRQTRLLLTPSQHDENLIRYFVVKKVKYLWDPNEDKYQRLRGMESSHTCSYFHEAKGLSVSHQVKRRVLYGVNSIEVHVTPILTLLFKEALSPFYVFQIFSTCVWFFDEYYYYATCIIIISAISLSATIYQTRKMERALRNTIETSNIVSVSRGNDEFVDLPSEDLVPGDVIEIPHHGCLMQCDAVLISGNCILNESMLTGESVPVTKTPVPDRDGANQKSAVFDLKEHARHTLFCGTQVIQTRYYGNQKVKAVVIRTGFQTSKGELVRAIMYPKPVDFKFNKDAYFFVGLLALVAGVGFVYTVVLMVNRGYEIGVIVKRSLDLITIAVPPALPAALTVGIMFAQRRMRDSQIYCISPRSINICGSINAVCFDKTGTLTEDGLNMQGVITVEERLFQDSITNMLLLRRGLMMDAMATCHSLTIIDRNLSGDPLDLIMFQAVNWELIETGEENSRFDKLVPTTVRPKSHSSYQTSVSSVDPSTGENIDEEIGIVRQFTFSSSLQRMSVITRRLGEDHFNLFAKGSPEMITSLCVPETVPEDFQEVLRSYTQHGYRVIALARKPLPPKYNYVRIQRVQREQLEKDLTFLGLLVLENKLKPETRPTIEVLKEANIRTVMVTGDNILTALSVARECTMVDKTDRVILVEASLGPGDMALPQLQFVYEEDSSKGVSEIQFSKTDMVTQIQIDEDSSTKFHFATTGKSWAILRQFYPEVLAKVLVRGAVFARMSPEQKSQLVESLQELGYYVGMCGDGANDCGALKTAHTGISLSEAEASVASPFTSKHANIECVPTVIREGRAALVTSFGIFKYMACYSLTQFVSVLILYHVSSNLADFQFLYIDLFLLTSLSISFGRTRAYPYLVKDPPQLSLLSMGPVLSLMLQLAIQVAAQVFCFLNVQEQPWFKPLESTEDGDLIGYENTAVFSISSYQYIILAIAFSKGIPYRQRMSSNYLFLLNIFVCLGMTVWITLWPLDAFVEFFELMPPPISTYRWVFFGVAVANCFLSIILETFLLDHEVIRRKVQSLKERCCPSSKFEYTNIEEDLAGTPGWPPVGTIYGEDPETNYSPNMYSRDSEELIKMGDNLESTVPSQNRMSSAEPGAFGLSVGGEGEGHLADQLMKPTVSTAQSSPNETERDGSPSLDVSEPLLSR